MIEELLVPSATAATMLSMTVKELHRYCKQLKIPHRKRGRQYFFAPDELKAWRDHDLAGWTIADIQGVKYGVAFPGTTPDETSGNYADSTRTNTPGPKVVRGAKGAPLHVMRPEGGG